MCGANTTHLQGDIVSEMDWSESTSSSDNWFHSINMSLSKVVPVWQTNCILKSSGGISWKIPEGVISSFPTSKVSDSVPYRIVF